MRLDFVLSVSSQERNRTILLSIGLECGAQAMVMPRLLDTSNCFSHLAFSRLFTMVEEVFETFCSIFSLAQSVFWWCLLLARIPIGLMRSVHSGMLCVLFIAHVLPLSSPKWIWFRHLSTCLTRWSARRVLLFSVSVVSLDSDGVHPFTQHCHRCFVNECCIWHFAIVE